MPNLDSVNSVQKACAFIEKSNHLPSHHFDTLDYVKKTTRFVKERFYHGLSHYSFSDNWIAWLLGKTVWSHFSVIVKPDDILKHQAGLCSQQAIVYMEILNKKKIVNRKVGMADNQGRGHFLTEVWYDHAWHVYDVNMEPDWTRIYHHHQSMVFYKQYPDTLYKAYEKKIPYNKLKQMLNHIEYGKSGEFPAKKMRLFHQFTFILVYLIPVICFALFIFYLKKRNY